MRPTRAPARSSRLAEAASRMAGAAGALLLQGGFLLLFLASVPAIRPPAPFERELAIIMPRLRPAPPPPAGGQGLPGPVRVTPVLPLLPGPVLPAPAPSAALPGLQDFGQALNDCAPEKFYNLSPEERALCPRPGAGVAIQEEPNLMGTPSHVKDEAHWETELARKKSQLWLPCFGPINGKPSINFICVAGMLADGTLTDPRAWPIYETKKLPPEDFYKIEQAYDQWHKEHPNSVSQIAKPSG